LGQRRAGKERKKREQTRKRERKRKRKKQTGESPRSNGGHRKGRGGGKKGGKTAKTVFKPTLKRFSKAINWTEKLWEKANVTNGKEQGLQEPPVVEVGNKKQGLGCLRLHTRKKRGTKGNIREQHWKKRRVPGKRKKRGFCLREEGGAPKGGGNRKGVAKTGKEKRGSIGGTGRVGERINETEGT